MCASTQNRVCSHNRKPGVATVFVVTSKNVALGVYPSMKDAVDSVYLEDVGAYGRSEWNEQYQEFYSPKHATVLTVVGVAPTPKPTPLTRA